MPGSFTGPARLTHIYYLPPFLPSFNRLDYNTTVMVRIAPGPIGPILLRASCSCGNCGVIALDAPGRSVKNTLGLVLKTTWRTFVLLTMVTEAPILTVMLFGLKTARPLRLSLIWTAIGVLLLAA